jgi:hypothetical protein
MLLINDIPNPALSQSVRLRQGGIVRLINKTGIGRAAISIRLIPVLNLRQSQGMARATRVPLAAGMLSVFMPRGSAQRPPTKEEMGKCETPRPFVSRRFTMRKSNLIRLQVEIDFENMEELEELQELGGARTKKDLWNNAITLLKWAAREQARGASIVSVNEAEGTYKELELPFLQTYATNMRRRQQRDKPDSERESTLKKEPYVREVPTNIKKHLVKAAAASSSPKTRLA